MLKIKKVLNKKASNYLFVMFLFSITILTAFFAVLAFEGNYSKSFDLFGFIPIFQADFFITMSMVGVGLIIYFLFIEFGIERICEMTDSIRKKA